MRQVFTTTHYLPSYARVGFFDTPHGRVYTPTFMPDGTRGAVKGLTPDMVAGAGIQVVLANTYHLHLMPGEQVVAALGGLHTFTGWKGPMLTDSGGFQIFSLAKHRDITEEGVTFRHPISGEKRLITPESSIRIQLALGADMIVAFDHLIGLDGATRSETKIAFDRTHRWLVRCIKEYKHLTKTIPKEQRPLLFGVVQGGLDENLRKQSLSIVQSSDVDGIAIGGLSVGETRQEMWRVLDVLAPCYDASRPRFLLGVGDPQDVRFAIDHGVDMLDCVMPTRNARHATVWVGDKERIHLTNARFIDDNSPIQEDCDCYACSYGFSKGFLRHQFKVGEPLAGTLASIHNLRYLSRICDLYKKA